MRRIYTGAAALAVCLCASVSAQQRAESPGATVTGTVTDAVTGRSLRNATVRLSARGSRFSVTTSTSATTGRFEIRSVPPGRYGLWASLPGYLEGGYQQRSALAPSVPVDVPERGAVETPLRLWKHSVISGQVTDEAGEPAAGVNIVPLEEAWSPDAVHLVRGRNRAVVTDDRGEYRLADLRPGTYVIGVAGTGAFPTGRSVGLDVDYGTAYSPGVTLADQAERITVGAAESRNSVNIRLPRTSPRSGTLRGQVTDGPPDLTWTVELVPALPASSTLSDLDVRRTTAEDGRFQFSAVSPGPYVVRAIAFTQFTNVKTFGSIGMLIPDPPDAARTIETKPTFWAETVAMVEADGSAQVTLRCRTGLQIRGELVWQGASPRPDAFSILRTSMTIRPLNGRVFTELATAKVDSRGRFSTVGLPPGRYGLDISLAPPGWSFLSISVLGRATGDGAIGLQDDDVSNVVVTLTDRPTAVSGLVLSVDSRPVPLSTVVVFPIDRRLWSASFPPRVIQTRPDASGRYVVDDLPAGEYYVVATSRDVPDRWQNPAFLLSLVPAASKIQIGDGTRANQNLTVTSAK